MFFCLYLLLLYIILYKFYYIFFLRLLFGAIGGPDESSADQIQRYPFHGSSEASTARYYLSSLVPVSLIARFIISQDQFPAVRSRTHRVGSTLGDPPRPSAPEWNERRNHPSFLFLFSLWSPPGYNNRCSMFNF